MAQLVVTKEEVQKLVGKLQDIDTMLRRLAPSTLTPQDFKQCMGNLAVDAESQDIDFSTKYHADEHTVKVFQIKVRRTRRAAELLELVKHYGLEEGK